MLGWVLALALAPAPGISANGVLIGGPYLALVGLISGAAVGCALALRARGSLRATQAAYERLDRSLAESERARDALVLANDHLARANVESRVMQVAFADLLNLADERTHGRLRALIEETGGELAELLARELNRGRPEEKFSAGWS